MLITPVFWWIIAFLVLWRVYAYMFYRPANFPPGPPRIPIFGSYLFLLLINGQHLQKAGVWLSKVYKSKVIGFYVGSSLTVVANDYESVKSVLNNQQLDGRPDIYVVRMRDPLGEVRGIFNTNGAVWREQRRFVLRHLRDYGFGRRFSDFEAELRDEISGFMDMLRSGPKFRHEFDLMRPQGEVMVPNIFFATMSNAFLKVLSGMKFTREEQGLLFQTGWAGMLFQKNSDVYGKLLSIVPWIRHLFPNMSSYNQLGVGNAVVYNFVKLLVDKHLKTFDEDHERNFIDLYIKELKKAEKTGDTNSSFNYNQLILTIVDFLIPVLTTVPSTFSFLVQRFLLQPEMMARMQQEIDDLVGGGRLPALDDRSQLPFTEACIREIMRLQTLLPTATAHISVEDTQIGGYDVPKDTFVLPGIDAFHNDPDLWGDPQNFRPDRFLGADGKLDLKLDKTLPFGAGKRLCAGETFSRNTLFLFISAFFQNFSIQLGEGEQFPDLSRNKTGIITYTPEFWVKVTPR